MSLHTEISSPFKLQELILVCSIFSTHRISLIMPLQTHQYQRGSTPCSEVWIQLHWASSPRKGYGRLLPAVISSMSTQCSLWCLYFFCLFSLTLILFSIFLIYVHSSIYLFIFGCAASMRHTGFSLVEASRGYSSLWCKVPGRSGFRSCSSWALEHWVNHCGTWALLLCGMWNLPVSGIEPASPALQGGFFTTELPGKPLFNFQ